MIGLSVIIPCRGHAAELRECLASLVGQTPEFEVELIVVDSAGDDAVAQAAREFRVVQLVRCDEPLSAGLARNRGLERAQGELVAFIDADCVADPDWLAWCRKAIIDPSIRLAGGPVLDLHPGRWIAAADNRLQFADHVATRSPGSARSFPACNMVLRREDLLAMGGFPGEAGEDILLCNSILARWAGSLRFEPRLRVRHAGRDTWKGYLMHQAHFGYTRAVSRLHLQAWHVRLGRRHGMIPLIALKRLNYLVSSGLRHGGIGKTLLLFPLLVPGLWRYGTGFVRGCRENSIVSS